MILENDEALAAALATENATEMDLLNARIARAATSWSAAFPGRKEVSRQVAKQARSITNSARRAGLEPAKVSYGRAGISEPEQFFCAIDALKL